MPSRTLLVSAPDPVAGHCWPMPPLETPGHSQASLAQSFLGSQLLFPGSWCAHFLKLKKKKLCPLRVSASPVLWKFSSEIILVFKVKFSEGSQSLCWIPRLRNLLWALELLQQCENFFGIIVLQFVGHLLGGYIVGLMAASSKKTYTTCWAS